MEGSYPLDYDPAVSGNSMLAQKERKPCPPSHRGANSPLP